MRRGTDAMDRHVAHAARWQSVSFAVRDVGRIAAASGVEFHAPLVDPRFMASLASAGGWRGFGGRSATLAALFGEGLPHDIFSRRDKAEFNEVFFADETRRFAESWSGGGVEQSVVDPERLRRAWLHPGDYRSAMLLQSAWLHDYGAARC